MKFIFMDLLPVEGLPVLIAGPWPFLVMFYPLTADISWTFTCSGMKKSLPSACKSSAVAVFEIKRTTDGNRGVSVCVPSRKSSSVVAAFNFQFGVTQLSFSVHSEFVIMLLYDCEMFYYSSFHVSAGSTVQYWVVT